jgi:hypothetical protein
MADTITTPQVDPDKQYRIKLARAIEVAPKIWARPGNEVTLKGSEIAQHGDAITSFEEV